MSRARASAGSWSEPVRARASISWSARASAALLRALFPVLVRARCEERCCASGSRGSAMLRGGRVLFADLSTRGSTRTARAGVQSIATRTPNRQRASAPLAVVRVAARCLEPYGEGIVTAPDCWARHARVALGPERPAGSRNLRARFADATFLRAELIEERPPSLRDYADRLASRSVSAISRRRRPLSPAAALAAVLVARECTLPAAAARYTGLAFVEAGVQTGRCARSRPSFRSALRRERRNRSSWWPRSRGHGRAAPALRPAGIPFRRGEAAWERACAIARLEALLRDHVQSAPALVDSWLLERRLQYSDLRLAAPARAGAPAQLAYHPLDGSDVRPSGVASVGRAPTPSAVPPCGSRAVGCGRPRSRARSKARAAAHAVPA